MHEYDWGHHPDIAEPGFQIVDAPSNRSSPHPLRHTERCKRCGCWLRANREENADDAPVREYCAACEDQMHKYSRPCAMCGESFFPDDSEVIRCPDCQMKFESWKRVCRSCGAQFLPHSCGVCNDRHHDKDTCFPCHWQAVHAESAAQRERICRVCGCRFLPRTCIVSNCKQKLTDICSVCHEEIEHMNMTAIIWTVPDCHRCSAVVDALHRQHRRVTRLSMEKLVKGEEPDVDAMAHLALTEGEAPLVFLDGRFLEPEEIDGLLGAKEDVQS